MAELPIIGAVVEQQLVITFSKKETGEGEVSFDFKPPIVEAVSPEQRAAVNVAHTVIKKFNLDMEKAQTNDTTKTVQ